ncbi:MAG: dihydropteroate synthase [Spirochaetota bacterium]|nr:dihydropteroate synthase [Spirochaetota bacterium]
MIIVADNIHIMNPVVEDAIYRMDPDPIQDIVCRCKAAGASIIDINPGPLSKSPEEKITFIIEAVQEVSDLRLSLDTSNPRALAAGIEICKQKPIINGFSLEPKKLTNILPLAAEYDTDIVGFLLSEKGQVLKNADERLNAALMLIEEADRIGLSHKRIIFDPIIVPITWQDGTRQVRETIITIQSLSTLIGTSVKSIIGLSNFTIGSPSLEKTLLLEQIYLPILANAGLNMVLLNAMHERTLKVANIYNFLNRDVIFSWEEI